MDAALSIGAAVPVQGPGAMLATAEAGAEGGFGEALTRSLVQAAEAVVAPAAPAAATPVTSMPPALEGLVLAAASPAVSIAPTTAAVMPASPEGEAAMPAVAVPPGEVPMMITPAVKGGEPLPAQPEPEPVAAKPDPDAAVPVTTVLPAPAQPVRPPSTTKVPAVLVREEGEEPEAQPDPAAQAVPVVLLAPPAAPPVAAPVSAPISAPKSASPPAVPQALPPAVAPPPVAAALVPAVVAEGAHAPAPRFAEALAASAPEARSGPPILPPELMALQAAPRAPLAESAASLPPAGSAAPPPARQVASVAVALAFTPGGSNGFSLALEPAELGRVEIHVQREGESHSIRVTAERPETLALLQRDRHELDRGLAEAGLRVEAGGISFALDTPDTGGGGAFGDRPAPGRRDAPPGGPARLPAPERDAPPPRLMRSLLDLNI